MDFMDVVKLRKSVRRYYDKEVEQEKIEQVLEAARLAPSWKNLQCWDFIVIKSREKIRHLVQTGALCGNTWASSAPVLIVACGDYSASGNRYGVPYFIVDVSIALEHLILRAADLGLGTCWVGVFDEGKIRSILDVPPSHKIVAITPLGYPIERKNLKKLTEESGIRLTKRRNLEDIVRYEKW